MIRALGAIAVALALVGCGFGAGEESGKVTVTVSRDFGRAEVAPTRSQTARAGDTVMRVLQRDFDVKTRFGGGFVQEIDGVSGGRANGRRVDWFYYVNGVEASDGAAQHRLEGGDAVWWDHHEWDAAMRVPAVVGAFPQPFKSGIGGKKLPIRLVCLGPVQRSCDEVEKRLQNAGIDTLARSNLESSPGEVLRVLVGEWRNVRKDIAARQLESGPGASGVFAKPGSSGNQIALLDAVGQSQRLLGPGGGLVAATSFEGQRPTWLITGTDKVGVAAAAAAMTEETLHDHFAVAIESGRAVALPLESTHDGFRPAGGATPTATPRP